MRSREPGFWLFCLLAASGALCVGNLVVTAVRTTAPRSLNGVVADKFALPEKHPGVDDVYVLLFVGGPPFQIERALYNAVEPGDHVQKESWTRLVRINDVRWTIPWSRDFLGMIKVMPALLVLAITLGFLAKQR